MSNYEFHTKICTKCGVEQHIYFFYFYALRNSYDSWCQYCRANASKNQKRGSRPEDDGSVRVCSGCGESKSLAEYYFHEKGQIHSKLCKICYAKRTFDNKAKRKYGVDWTWREETLMAQGNKCAICEIPFNDTNFQPHIDHNASNGRARAILCPICNIMLGMHYENCETLRAAGFDRHAEYLERYKRLHEIKLVG